MDRIMIFVGIGFAVLLAVVFIILKLRSKSTAKSAKDGKTSAAAKKKNAKTIQNSIPYLHTYDEGIIETTPGVYTAAYTIPDINFKIAPDEDQIAIFVKYGRLLNSFTSDVEFQVVIHNKTADPQTTFKNIQYAPQSDGLNSLRREMNDILIDKMREGRNNITQDKYLVFSVKAESFQDARRKIEEVERLLDRKSKDISRENPLERLSIVDRLHTLYSLYNQEENDTFYNTKDKNGNPGFDVSQLMKTGANTKDVIAPYSMDFSPTSHFSVGDTYGKVLYLDNFPNWLSSDFLAELAEINSGMLISMHYQPVEQAVAIKTIHNMMLGIDGQIAERQKKAFQSGYSMDLISPDLKKQQKFARDLIDDMVSRDQKMFLVSFTITVFGETKEIMEENARQVMNTANNFLCSLKPLAFQQEIGFNSSLPLCLNLTHVSKMLTTESASIFIPYTTQELHQKDGLYYGINDTSKNMILFNRLLGENFNGLILGESGNGKSFAAKLEMMSVVLKHPNSVVYVIDPEAEYTSLAKALNGQVINLAPGSSSYLNPLDMDLLYGDETDPVSMKTEFIISMIEIMVGNGRVLTPEEKTIISRCVQQIYRPYLNALDDANRAGANITFDKDATPTLSTLFNAITLQPEPAAKSIANVLEMYATGSLATFAHRTNVDLNSKFVVYNIKNLGTGTKDLGLHVCLNSIWNKMVENEQKGIFTWFYIDEFYLLLQSESSANFLSSIWKRARKRLGVPTGILQNTEDLLRTDESRAILNNSSFVEMLSLKKIDRGNIKNLLSISDAQIAHITDAGFGRGLIYAGKTIVPFNNQIPEDTKIYEIMSTSAAKDEIKKKYKFVD